MASKTRQPPNKTRRPDQTPRKPFATRVMSLSRAGRMVVVGVSVLIFAFAMWNVVSALYVRIFPTTIFDPAIIWIVTGLCLGMYLAGYVYIIGTPGETPTAGRAQTVYLLVTALLLIVSIVWFIVQATGAVAE